MCFWMESCKAVACKYRDGETKKLRDNSFQIKAGETEEEFQENCDTMAEMCSNMHSTPKSPEDEQGGDECVTFLKGVEADGLEPAGPFGIALV